MPDETLDLHDLRAIRTVRSCSALTDSRQESRTKPTPQLADLYEQAQMGVNFTTPMGVQSSRLP
jgi:hypothetical protein